MKYIFLIFMVIVSFSTLSKSVDHKHGLEDNHLHAQLVDGSNLDVDPDRFGRFIKNLDDLQIVIVSVKGMVCDFCARGLEKTFKKDTSVKKIDVDLKKGKIFIAYTSDKNINFNDIKQKIVANGQDAFDMQIFRL